MGISVLIVGGGGREHALAWKIAKSPLVSKIYAAPGNPGIAQHAECVPLAPDDLRGVRDFAVSKRIDLTVVGPEAPLVAGLADREVAVAGAFGLRGRHGVIAWQYFRDQPEGVAT